MIGVLTAHQLVMNTICVPMNDTRQNILDLVLDSCIDDNHNASPGQLMTCEKFEKRSQKY